MAQKWNLQDIRPPQAKKQPGRQRRRPSARPHSARQPSEPSTAPREDIPSITIEDGRKRSSRNVLLSIVLFIVIVGGALLLSAMLGKTELTIYPEYREPNINAEFIAYPERRDNELSYEIMTLETTGESQVKASGQTEVQEQAEGVITIFKTTPGAERLIKNTRFRSPDGLVFRIQESVVVPGSVKGENGANVPGSIQADAFADDVGEDYNLAAGTRFDIPGFEEGGFTQLYEAMYAENNAAFTGGFDGPQFQIDENELATARQALQVKLRDNLLARVDTEKPSDFISFPGAIAITYNQLPAMEFGNDLVTIREQAILQIPLFRTSELGSFLAKETIATYNGSSPVRLDDPSVLSFAYSSATTSASVIANEPSLQFTFTGKPLLVWEYEAEKLKKDLAGLPKTAINNAIAGYPGIEGARVRITPFWKRTFPTNPEDILLTEELRAETE